MKSKVVLKEEMNFIGELDGFDIPIDADEEFGGKNKGPKPKGLILTALAGCTAMDVISVLRKMRAEPDDFSVEVEAELIDAHPKTFKSFLVKYYFKGGKVTEDRAKRAVELSLDNYCGVAAMLKKVGPIDYKIFIS